MPRGRPVLVVLLAVAAAGWVWWRYFPQTLPAFVNAHAPRSPLANPPLYKWRDATGTWQITDTPPPDRPYETVVVDPRQNVVPTVVPGRTTPPDSDD
jgi:hypothetical protein